MVDALRLRLQLGGKVGEVLALGPPHGVVDAGRDEVVARPLGTVDLEESIIKS